MNKRFEGVLHAIEQYSPSTPFWQRNPHEIYVYGTGTMGQDVCKALVGRGLPMRGYLDHMSQAVSIGGLPVRQPNDEAISNDERERGNVVIAIHNPHADIPAICSRLRAFGYKHIINPIELYDYLSLELGIRYWLCKRDFYKSLGPILERTFQLWADETSQDVFLATLEHRLTGDYNLLPPVDWEHRYAPADIPSWNTPARLIDCGAYDGDSILDLQKAGITFEAIAAFEPDAVTFPKLSGLFDSNPGICRNVTVWPCGVYSSTTQLKFNANQGENSALSSSGDVTVQCVSIDEALPNFAPTLIKMDIEAAEYDALIGAQKTIRQYKPGLAISLYHRPEHLWQIPLLVERLANAPSIGGPASNAMYRYYIRAHMTNGFELVFYAIPA